MLVRASCSAVLVATLVLLAAAAPAAAGGVDVIVDSTAVDLEGADDGGHTADVVLINAGAAAVAVTAAIAGDAGCSVVPDPAALEPGRRTVVTLTLSSGCDDLDEGAEITLAFGGGATPSSVVVAADPPADADPDWVILAWALLATAWALVGVACWIGIRVSGLNADRAPDQTIRWNTTLEGLGTDWSFKDAWVSNVTIGATALVGLLAASDVLEAVLGDEPKAALALITVASAGAAVLVGLGPLILKATGPESGVPTVAGTILAGQAVLAGSLFQISAVTIQAAELTDEGWLRVVVYAIGVAVAGTVAYYGARSLAGLVATVAAPPPLADLAEGLDVYTLGIADFPPRRAAPPRRTALL